MGAALAAPVGSRQPLLQLLQDLQQSLYGCFEAAAVPRAALGLELLCKLEEQLLLPALKAIRSPWPALGRQMSEVGTLRDLSARLEVDADADAASQRSRRARLALLEGVTRLHFDGLGDLLHEAEEADMPWADLERETRALLRRWQAEVREHGEIEDEDGDPVGQSPR